MCESPSAFMTKTRKARKDHKCCECSRPIRKSESYQYSSGVWDGEAYSFKQCLGCSGIMEAAAKSCDDYYEGPEFGNVSEWFYNFMCRDFKGKEFLNGMAEKVGIDPDKLSLLLKLDLTK